MEVSLRKALEYNKYHKIAKGNKVGYFFLSPFIWGVGNYAALPGSSWLSLPCGGITGMRHYTSKMFLPLSIITYLLE